MFNPFRAVAGMFRKSPGEKRILAMLNGNSTLIAGNLWNNRRSEYVNHFTGWNFVAIDAIASEIAGMQPICALKRDEGAQGQLQKCLSSAQRRKALTGLQSQVELEPVSHEHPLMRLNANPNPIDCSWTYWYKVVMFLRSVGEAYIWDAPNAAGPKESWVLPAHWVWPIPGDGKIIGAYEVRPISSYLPDASEPGNWFWFGGGAGKFTVPADQIIPFFMPSPHSMVGGYSPVAACSAWTDATDNIDRSRIFRFQNDAFPSVAVEFDKDIDPDTITQAEIDRLKAMIKEKYAGVRRTGEPVVLGPGMRLVYMQTTPKDMAYVEGFAQMRDSLMACHRTGPVIAGLGNETTHAAARAVRAGWHSSTITPIVKMLGQVLTERRCRKFDPDLVWFWMDSSPEDLEFEQKQRTELLDRGVITLNEARAQVGIAPHGGANEEIGDMTLLEAKAHFAVPRGLGMGAPADHLGEPVTPDGDSRIDRIFKPSGNGSQVDGKMKALADLRNQLLLAAQPEDR